MKVLLGNGAPHAHIVDHEDPCEYTWYLPDGVYTHEIEGRPNGKDALIHVLTRDIPRLPGHEAFVSVVKDWPNHSPVSPTYVHSTNDTGEADEVTSDLAAMISEAYDIPVGRPDDVEDTHHTISGPPGVGPEPALEVVPNSAEG